MAMVKLEIDDADVPRWSALALANGSPSVEAFLTVKLREMLAPTWRQHVDDVMARAQRGYALTDADKTLLRGTLGL